MALHTKSGTRAMPGRLMIEARQPDRFTVSPLSDDRAEGGLGDELLRLSFRAFDDS